MSAHMHSHIHSLSIYMMSKVLVFCPLIHEDSLVCQMVEWARERSNRRNILWGRDRTWEGSPELSEVIHSDHSSTSPASPVSHRDALSDPDCISKV